MWDILPLALIGILALAAAAGWIRRRTADPYDLRTLRQDEPEPPGDAYDDMVTEDSGPYCSACDEPFPAGTWRCTHCGRPL